MGGKAGTKSVRGLRTEFERRIQFSNMPPREAGGTECISQGKAGKGCCDGKKLGNKSGRRSERVGNSTDGKKR